MAKRRQKEFLKKVIRKMREESVQTAEGDEVMVRCSAPNAKAFRHAIVAKTSRSLFPSHATDHLSRSEK